MASSGRGSFLGRPQPLKLRNIEYLLKQLDSHSLDLSPASSTEMSAPEADKAFAAVEIGSHTESQQGGQDMADPIFSPSNDYGRAEAHLHHYNTSQQLCNFDDSSGYPPQAYGEEPIDPSYMAEGFGPVSTNFNSPNTPSPFKIEQVANGRHNGSKWTKGENANMRSFNDGFHQQQFPQPRVPPRGDTSSTSRSQLGNGRFNSFSRPNDDYDCGGNH